MGEFSYTACGELLTASSHAPHPDPRLGHKGLFLDRLDTGVVDPLTGAEVARHALGAKHTYFMVNRSYDPQLGRFLQRDPNATGLLILTHPVYGGSALVGNVNPLDLDTHLADGVAIYAYVGGNSWINGDPLGLFIPSIGPTDTLMMGYDVMKESSAMIGNYSFDLEMDADWAMDWSASDIEFSRISTWQFDGGHSPYVSGGPAMASLARFGAGAVKIGARGAISAVSRTLHELHHIIPKFLGGLKGKKGSLYGLNKVPHQRQLHSGIAALTQKHFGLHPNAGKQAFESAFSKLNPTVIHNFRRDLYGLMRTFDAQHGTALVAAFRREFQRQRQHFQRAGGQIPGIFR